MFSWLLSVGADININGPCIFYRYTFYTSIISNIDIDNIFIKKKFYPTIIYNVCKYNSADIPYNLLNKYEKYFYYREKTYTDEKRICDIIKGLDIPTIIVDVISSNNIHKTDILRCLLNFNKCGLYIDTTYFPPNVTEQVNNIKWGISGVKVCREE